MSRSAPLLLLLVLCAGARTAWPQEPDRPTVLYFSDVPVRWIPGAEPESRITFFVWLHRTLLLEGAPTLIPANPELVEQQAVARGLKPVVERDPNGSIVHFAFEETDLEVLCDLASSLGMKYVLKVRPEGPPSPSSVATPSGKLSVEYTVYDSVEKKILATRWLDLSAHRLDEVLAGLQAGRALAQTIAAELASIGSGRSTTPEPIRLDRSHIIWLGRKDGETYGPTLTLLAAERIDNANLRLVFTLRNEYEENLTIEPVADESGDPKTYLKDALGIRYGLTPLESSRKTRLRVWERRDFSLTFTAPPASVQKVDLESAWIVELGPQKREFHLTFTELPLDVTVPVTPPEPAPSQTSPFHPPEHNNPPAPR